MLAVVAHTKRHEQAHKLMADVGAAYMTIDGGNNPIGCNENHRKAWTFLNNHLTQGDWGIVIEDDAEPVEDFTNQLNMVLAAAPTNIVSLYLGTGRPTELPFGSPNWQHRIAKHITTNDCWLTTDRLLHAVAVAIRHEHIQPMLEWTHRHHLDWDQAITDYAHYNAEQVAYCVPSIIDHKDQPTLVQHNDCLPRTEPRKAWTKGARTHWDTSTTEF